MPTPKIRYSVPFAAILAQCMVTSVTPGVAILYPDAVDSEWLVYIIITDEDEDELDQQGGRFKMDQPIIIEPDGTFTAVDYEGVTFQFAAWARFWPGPVPAGATHVDAHGSFYDVGSLDNPDGTWLTWADGDWYTTEASDTAFQRLIPLKAA